VTLAFVIYEVGIRLENVVQYRRNTSAKTVKMSYSYLQYKMVLLFFGAHFGSTEIRISVIIF